MQPPIRRCFTGGISKFGKLLLFFLEKCIELILLSKSNFIKILKIIFLKKMFRVFPLWFVGQSAVIHHLTSVDNFPYFAPVKLSKIR